MNGAHSDSGRSPQARDAPTSGADADAAAQRPPLLRVVRGRPSAAELAALVTVVAARSSAVVEEPPPRQLSAWTDRRQGLRRPLPVGRGAWVASGLVQGTRTRAGW